MENIPGRPENGAAGGPAMKKAEFENTKAVIRARTWTWTPESKVWYIIGYVGGNDEQSFTGKQLRELFDLVKEGEGCNR